MKKIIQFTLFLFAILLPTTASAHDFEVNGIYYLINGSEATVTYKGTSSSQYSNEYSGSVTIPSTVTYGGVTYTVTSIGDYAFYYCTGLTNVTIPNTITSIGEYAFDTCRNLNDINIPNSVSSIGYGAFAYSGWLNNQPDGLVYAGKVAYFYKGTMPEGTHITLRDGTLGIAGAFEYCSGLASITIPNTVTSIGRAAFYKCTSLTSITIPSSVTSIGSDTFYGFSSGTFLRNIIIRWLFTGFFTGKEVCTCYDGA